jgi:endoglucanase
VIFDAILNKFTAIAAVIVLTALATIPASASAGVANQGLSGASASDPLAGVNWGHFTGTLDGVYPAYAAARGRDRRLLAKIALRPLAFWFGAWDADRSAKQVARQYIKRVTGGNPNVLAQVTVFRLTPWEGEACSELPDPGQQASYRRWIDGFAAGIGSARVALILQPDIPFALCSPGGSQLPLHLIAYAAHRFSALPHTTVYIDGGTVAWDSATQAARLLQAAGIRHARGFALDTTQTASTASELDFGAAILRHLGAAGIKGKHFVVNTAENGAPFLAGQYPGNPNDPRACRNRHDHLCVTLGIPPTTDTSAPAWGLPRRERSIAARDADAYLWIGRPWLGPSSDAFDRSRALALASTTPF